VNATASRLAGRARAFPAEGRAHAGDRLRRLRDWARAAPDLATLAVLFVLIACFGRPFAKLGGSGIYPTEIALAVAIVFALRRVGLAGAWERVERVVPLIPLGVLWLAGAIAAVRGLAQFGISSTLHDVGLVEYSVFVPLVAVAVDSREKGREALQILSYAGLAGTFVFALVFAFAPYSRIGVVENPTAAVGIYLALYALPVVARLAFGERPGALELGIAALGIALMVFASGRSVLLALLLALGILAALSPRPLRVAALGAAGLLAAALAVAGIQELGYGDRGFEAVPGPPSVTVGSTELALDDELHPAIGGTLVTNDAADGSHSREVGLNQPVDVPEVKGLVPGQAYRIQFAVRPLEARRTRGVVGNNAGTGWDFRYWFVKPERRWQRVETQLTATAPVERLMVVPDLGSARVRIDAISIAPADPGRVAAAPPAAEELERGHRSPLVSALVDSFNPNSAAGHFQNGAWRIDYWAYLARKTLRDPVFGAGFGRPAAFHWHGNVYDTRNDVDAESVSPPHNSFMNLLYRTGLLALGALVVLLWIAVRGFLRQFRATRAPELAALLALLAFICVVAFLNVALEGPYMAMFFWTVVGLMLALPVLSGAVEPRRLSRPRFRRRAASEG
jgi:hypothetical protein